MYLFVFSAEYTLQLDGDVNAVRVTDSKVPARMLFLDRNELPKPGGKNPLREAWAGGYATEMFYFPASSLKITNILRYGSRRNKIEVKRFGQNMFAWRGSLTKSPPGPFVIPFQSRGNPVAIPLQSCCNPLVIPLESQCDPVALELVSQLFTWSVVFFLSSGRKVKRLVLYESTVYSVCNV